MGLRQLYFLIGGLLNRLVYLSYGLAIILGFIGVKLILEALHTNEVPFINGGEPVPWAPEIPIWLSLVVIFGTIAVTAVASLAKTRRDVRRADNRVLAEPGTTSPVRATRPGAAARHREWCRCRGRDTPRSRRASDRTACP